MNAEQLASFADRFLGLDSELEVQAASSGVRDALNNLTNSPSEPSYQQNVVNALDRLRVALLALNAALTPSQANLLEKLSGTSWYREGNARSIQEELARNAATPAVVSQAVSREVEARERFLENLRSIKTTLSAINVDSYEDQDFDAELSILIPRSLFHNDLSGLQKELAEISRIYDIFSEVATGEKRSPTVHQISTSDPTFFLGADVSTAVAIAGSITWLLNTWKQALEIKELRNKVDSSGVFSAAELSMFEKKVEDMVEKAIEERVVDLTGGKTGGRSNELKNGLRYALKALMARIERGMTIEVRIPDLRAVDDSLTDAQEEAKDVEVAMLEGLAREISYPEPTGEPILSLPNHSQASPAPDE